MAMPEGLFMLIMPVAALAVNAAVQVLAFRLSVAKLLSSIPLGFCAGLAALALMGAADYAGSGRSGAEHLALMLTNALTYAAFGYGYFHFINLGETARRVRLLVELRDSTGGLTEEQILARYNSGEMVQKRLNRLLANGQVVFKGGRYYIGGRLVLLMTRVMEAAKLALLGKRSEFG